MSTKIAKSSVSKAPFSPRSASVGNVSTKKTVTKTKPKTQSKDVAKTSVKSTGSKEKGMSKGTTNVQGGNIGILIGTKVGVANTYVLNQNITTSNNSSNSKYIPPGNNYVPSTSNTSMIYNSSGTRSTYTPGYSQPQKSNDKTQSSSSAYLDRPKSVEISKNATQPKNNSIGVVPASSDRPAESYPTPKEERDAAEKQQQYALKHPKIVTTVPPKTVKPIKKPKPNKTKTVLKPKPAPEPTFFESEINPFIKLNNKQIKGLKTGASLALSMLPIIGDAKDLAEFITGKDLITGQKLSKLERVAALVSVCIPYVSAAGVVAAKGAVKQGGKQVFKKVSKETGEKLLNELGEDGLQEISEKMLKKLDANDLKKVEETLEKAEKERKTKEVLEKAVDGGKIGGKGGRYSKIYYKGTTKVDGELRDISRIVYQRTDIDWEWIDPETGLTNKQLAQKGLAPYWQDGTKIELHHLLQ